MLSDYEKYGYFTIFFVKVNEQYKVISNEEYTICNAVTKECSGVKSKIGQYGEHTFHTIYSAGENNLDELPINIMLSNSILEEIENINTLADIEQFREHPEIFSIIERPIYNNVLVTFYYPVLIKQTKAIPGYTKTDLLYRGQATLTYTYDSNRNITSKSIGVSIEDDLLSFNSNEQIKMDSLFDLAPYFPNEETQVDRTCFNTNDSGTIIINDPGMCRDGVSLEFISTSYSYIPFFVTRKKTVSVEIENTVNGVSKFDATKEKELNYKILIKNTGESPSENNTIITYVPNEISVDTNSISDNGTYDKDNHTITWTLEIFNANETKTFTYKGLAPKDFQGKELFGYSTVKSDDIQTAITSNNTIVVMGISAVEEETTIHNPNTSNYGPNFIMSKPFLLAFSVLIVVTIVLAIKFKQKRFKIK